MVGGRPACGPTVALNSFDVIIKLKNTWIEPGSVIRAVDLAASLTVEESTCALEASSGDRFEREAWREKSEIVALKVYQGYQYTG